MKKALPFFALLLSLLLPLSSFASTPDPSVNPVLAAIQKQGAKFYYLGNRFNMDGWFIVKDGQVQIAYSTQDNKGTIIGALFGESGENITATQMATLVQSNKDVAALIANASKEQAALNKVGSPPPAAGQNAGNMPSTPLSPGEKLIQDLSNVATVVIGNPKTPEVLMVMDPHCAHCQATWKIMKDSIVSNKVHLRMIPMGTQDTDNERAAAVLLGVADPLNAWDKYVAGDAAQLAGTPTTMALAAVRANHALIDQWNIDRTPYLVYRDKEGKVKILQGEPSNLSLLLNDLGVKS